jgi:hypothetical protein
MSLFFQGALGSVGDAALGTDAKRFWYLCPDAAHWFPLEQLVRDGSTSAR